MIPTCRAYTPISFMAGFLISSRKSPTLSAVNFDTTFVTCPSKMGTWILMAAAPTALWREKKTKWELGYWWQLHRLHSGKIKDNLPKSSPLTTQHAFLSYFYDLPWLSTEDNWDHLRFMNKMLCMYTPFELLLLVLPLIMKTTKHYSAWPQKESNTSNVLLGVCRQHYQYH